jgi:branched-chain amino acid transport system substrate-binding protein
LEYFPDMKAPIAILAAAVFALMPFAGIAEEPYDIACIAPLTGPFAFLGKEEANAIEALQAQVNKSGGIRGRQIHFTIADDQSIPQNAVQLLNASIARRAPVVLGSSTASNCGAMAPLVASGPVVYCFSPGIHPPPGSYMFSASISTADYIIGTIRYLRGRGWRKVAIMTSNDATGQDADKIIDEAVNAPENQGLVSLVAKEHFNVSDISVAAQISRIKASGAQAVIFWSVGTSFGTLVREAVNAGLTIPEFSSAGNLNYAQLEAYQSFMPDNLYMMAPPWAAPNVFPNAKFRKYATGYFDAFKASGVKPDEGQSISWDPAQIVLEALRHLGLDATPAAIRAYIAGLQGFIGINGQYDFKAIPQRGIGAEWLVMIRWDKNKQSPVGVSKPGGDPL